MYSKSASFSDTGEVRFSIHTDYPDKHFYSILPLMIHMFVVMIITLYCHTKDFKVLVIVRVMFPTT